MNGDLSRITLRWSWASWALRWTFTTHGVQRRDGAGSDRYVRVGPVVLGIPHGWRRVESLRDLARDKNALLAELEIARFRYMGRFNP